MTNADKIRAMDDEEIAEFLERLSDACGGYYKSCESCPIFQGYGNCKAIEWLQKEADEDSGKEVIL